MTTIIKEQRKKTWKLKNIHMYYVALIFKNPLGTKRGWNFLKYICEEILWVQKNRSLMPKNQNGFCKQSHDNELKSASPINEKYAIKRSKSTSRDNVCLDQSSP